MSGDSVATRGWGCFLEKGAILSFFDKMVILYLNIAIFSVKTAIEGQFGVLQRQACRLLVQHGVERILDRTPDQCF